MPEEERQEAPASTQEDAEKPAEERVRPASPEASGEREATSTERSFRSSGEGLPFDDERLGGEDERGLFGRFTRKLRDRRELTDDAWKAMGAVLTTSDRAKSEFIRMLGREVRHYLDGLQLTDDLKELVTNHSLEVHASFHLKPLVKEDEGEEEEEEEE